MNKINVYVVGGALYYTSPLDKDLFKVVNTKEEADILLFTGGEDVTPELYGAEKHNTTYNNSHRDRLETEFFKYAQKESKMCLGVCRGSQILAALSGAKLIQHCDNHAIVGNHEIMTTEGNVINVTSTHHQAAYPFNLPKEDYELLAIANNNLSTFRFLDPITQADANNPEVEVIYYNKTHSLGVQGHPEMHHATKEFIDYFNDIILKVYAKQI